MARFSNPPSFIPLSDAMHAANRVDVACKHTAQQQLYTSRASDPGFSMKDIIAQRLRDLRMLLTLPELRKFAFDHRRDANLDEKIVMGRNYLVRQLVATYVMTVELKKPTNEVTEFLLSSIEPGYPKHFKPKQAIDIETGQPLNVIHFDLLCGDLMHRISADCYRDKFKLRCRNHLPGFLDAEQAIKALGGLVCPCANACLSFLAYIPNPVPVDGTDKEVTV